MRDGDIREVKKKRWNLLNPVLLRSVVRLVEGGTRIVEIPERFETSTVRQYRRQRKRFCSSGEDYTLLALALVNPLSI